MAATALKIWYQNPVPLLDEFKGLEILLQQTIREMGRERTEVDLKWLKAGFFNPTFSYTLTYNTLSQTQRIYEAEKEGYDAIVIGNAIDFGLREARSIVSIPVIGVLESALYVASSLGNKYSIVVIHNQTGQFIENTVKQYGMTDRLAKLADLGVTLSEVAALYGDPEKLMGMFKENALKTIKEDNAEVIIAGCTILSSLLTLQKIHSIEGVPVIDPVYAGIKMAEVMVDLQRSYGVGVCRSSIYNTCPDWEKEIPIKR